MDNYSLWERHDAEQERWLNSLPKCCVCKEPIQDEKFYDFDGDYVCEHCVSDYIDKHFRVKTEDYIE